LRSSPGFAAFIEAHSNRPKPVSFGEGAEGHSQTAYDLLRISSWALVIIGALPVIVGLIGKEALKPIELRRTGALSRKRLTACRPSRGWSRLRRSRRQNPRPAASLQALPVRCHCDHVRVASLSHLVRTSSAVAHDRFRLQGGGSATIACHGEMRRAPRAPPRALREKRAPSPSR